MQSSPPTSLRRSWAIQRRVIRALLLREILTRYGRHNIGFLWLFAEPMLFTLFIVALWTAFDRHHGSTLPIVAFAVTGYSSVLLWRNMPGRCVSALAPNAALMFHRNVKIFDIYAARLLLEAGGATISFFVLSLLFIYTEHMPAPEDLVKVATGWVMLAWFGAGLALCVATLAEKYEIVERIWHPISYIMFPLSGAAFLVDAFPPDVQQMVLWVPMVHGVELLREGYFGSAIRAHYDIPYFAAWCMGLTLMGLARVRYLSRVGLTQ